MRRIRLCFTDNSNKPESSDWYRYRNLNTVELRSILFPYPFDPIGFEQKVASLQHWFTEDEWIFSKESSQYLIARLLLAQREHASRTAATIDSHSMSDVAIANFVKYVNDLPTGSLKRLLTRNSLLAEQQLYDMKLQAPNLDNSQLLSLRDNFLRLVHQYEDTSLAPRLVCFTESWGRLASGCEERKSL